MTDPPLRGLTDGERANHRHDLILLRPSPRAPDVGDERIHGGPDPHGIAERRIGRAGAARGTCGSTRDRAEIGASRQGQQEHRKRQCQPASGAGGPTHCSEPQRSVAGSAVAHFQVVPSRQMTVV